MNKQIFKIAIPNIISNITVPVMGLVATAIAGHCGDSAHAIGALAIGVSIFNFLYWNCSFVRMGTSGLTAQAFGANDFHETTVMLARAMVLALGLGTILLLLQYPLGELFLWAMNGDSMVSDYFYARIWAVPAGILLYGFYGWCTGMQNAMIPMITSITVNVVHMCLSLWFVFGFNIGIVGIAYASVVAQWSGVILAGSMMFFHFRKTLCPIKLLEIIDLQPIKRFIRINLDIIIRTFCLVIVYTFFTAASARMEDDGGVILAVNAMLMQLYTLFSYMSDGFAYAAEALIGRYVGAKDEISLRKCMHRCYIWGGATAVIAVILYVGWWQDLFGIFIGDNITNASQIIEVARRYVYWIVIVPLLSALPFLLDGFMVGATMTKIMRDSMVISTIGYFATFYIFKPIIGNDALWLAFALYMVIRGILQIYQSHNLDDILEKARH